MTLQKVLNNEVANVIVDKKKFFFNTLKSCFTLVDIKTKVVTVQKK